MCGRFSSSSKDIGSIADDLGAQYEGELAAAWRPRYNVAPTQPALVARLAGGARVLATATWGFGGAINARAETAAAKPTFAAAFAQRRCVIPADGFYEWKGAKGKRQPVWFHPAAGGLIYLAAVYDVSAAGAAFVILTTTPCVEVAPVHDRMPVVLARDGAHAWLTAADSRLLAPTVRGFLAAKEVSARVNDVRNDDAECLSPWKGQMSLL